MLSPAYVWTLLLAGESSTQVSPFLPGGVSDGNWHTVHIHYYNKVGLRISLFVSPGPFRFSVSLLIFRSVSQMSVWWVMLWSFYILLVIICTVLLIRRHISFSVSRALWIELTGLCMAWCGCLPVTISFMHIHRTSPLIFFMFFHSPQPTTRYVSMSVCQSAHTLPLFLSPFFPFYLSVFFLPADNKWRVSVSVFIPLFSSPCAVRFVSCLTNAKVLLLLLFFLTRYAVAV